MNDYRKQKKQQQQQQLSRTGQQYDSQQQSRSNSRPQQQQQQQFNMIGTSSMPITSAITSTINSTTGSYTEQQQQQQQQQRNMSGVGIQGQSSNCNKIIMTSCSICHRDIEQNLLIKCSDCFKMFCQQCGQQDPNRQVYIEIILFYIFIIFFDEIF